MADSVEKDNQINGKVADEEKAEKETNCENNSNKAIAPCETKIDDSVKIVNNNSNGENEGENDAEKQSSDETDAEKQDTKKENKTEIKETQHDNDTVCSEAKQESPPIEDSSTKEVPMEQNNADADSSINSEVQGDDQEDESDETPKVLTEKRQRKKVTRFSYDDATPNTTEKKKVEIPDGKGTPLGEHPRVEMQIQKNRGEDLKIIHKFFFGVFGEALTCKKAIRQFRGFAFEKDSPEYEKKEEYLGRFTLDNLKWALTICDVERKGKKEDLIDLLMEWSLCPKPSEKTLPAKQSKKKTPNKRNSMSGKQVSKKSTGQGDSPSRKKRTTPKKSGSPQKRFHFDEEDSETLATKKKKQAPTNAQIKKSIQKILKDANLEEITMKTVCLKVYALYPDYDISDRKAFIKETVKKIIS